MHRRLAEIRSKLDRLRAADDERGVFGALRAGAHSHDYREAPALDAQRLLGVEALCGVSLPEELREFLQHVHGGGAGAGYGFDLWGEPRRASRPSPCILENLAALTARRPDDRYASLPTIDDDDVSPPGDGFLRVAHHGGSVYDVIVVTGRAPWTPLVLAHRVASVHRGGAPNGLSRLVRGVARRESVTAIARTTSGAVSYAPSFSMMRTTRMTARRGGRCERWWR